MLPLSGCILTSFIVLFCAFLFLFFFNDPATTEIYTLSLHDALPILGTRCEIKNVNSIRFIGQAIDCEARRRSDRKSTRLNSSHTVISYAVFCLKKKKQRIMSLTAVRHPVSTLMPQTATISTRNRRAR